MANDTKPFSDKELAEREAEYANVKREIECMVDLHMTHQIESRRFLDTIAERDERIRVVIEANADMKRALQMAWKENATLTAEVEEGKRLRDNTEPKVITLMMSVTDEFTRATEKFGPFASTHEGYAVIKEELDELWDAVKANDPIKAITEARQVSAMGLRFMYDIATRIWKEADNS